MSIRGMLMRSFGMTVRFLGVLSGGIVIAFIVMLGGGAMRLGSVLVVFGGFGV